MRRLPASRLFAPACFSRNIEGSFPAAGWLPLSTLQRIVVLVIDRLRPAFLGPYGNTWVETDAFNELASQSLLAEQVFTESTQLAAGYRRLWYPPSAVGSTPVDPATDLISLARQHGWRTTLLTDEPQWSRDNGLPDLDEQIVLPVAAAKHPAVDVESTPFAALMAQTLEAVERMQSDSLLWVHARGLSGPWNAPYAWRQMFAAEEDPDPPTFVDPPAERLPADIDPDQLLGLAQAYAAEVRVVDECLWPLVSRINSSAGDDTAWVVTSTRGYPLGEHGVVGDGPRGDLETVFAEAAHVPLFIRVPSGQDAAARTQRLCQLTDLHAWLDRRLRRLPWSPGASLDGTSGGEREGSSAITVGSHQLALRTSDWCLIRSPGHEPGGLPGEHLFVRPDDAWEANDVAGLLPDTTAWLRSQLPFDAE